MIADDPGRLHPLARETPRAPRRAASAHAQTTQLGILLAYLVLGILVTWPRATYLRGILPAHHDQGQDAWDLWWVAHQLSHLASPFTTRYMVAPVGVPLGYHTLMPLVGVVMAPITLTAGPGVGVNLLAVLLPGVASYAMYRAARLWLGPVGAFAAGAFFGLSSMYAYRLWTQADFAAGIVFLPITLEVAVRLRRDPSWWRAATVGFVLGCAALVDLEPALMALAIAVVVLAPWLARRPSWRTVGMLALAGAVAVVLAAPLIVALVQQRAAIAESPALLAHDYLAYGIALPQMFTPSPRVASFGLRGLAHLYSEGLPAASRVPPWQSPDSISTFGVTLTALALLGVVVGWRTPRMWLWLALWLGAAAVALGPVLELGGRTYVPLPTHFGGQSLSRLMPYTWLVRVLGLSAFREANRFAMLGLVPASLLAGGAVDWIRRRWAPGLALVVVLAALELGWSTTSPQGNMPTSFPALTHAIAADRSASVVVDVPYGLRGGGNKLGPPWLAQELLNAVGDGHPRAIGYVSRIPLSTIASVCRHPFYANLLIAQSGRRVPPSAIAQARADARRMNLGWAIVWTRPGPRLRRYLAQTGFSHPVRADGTVLYRATGRGGPAGGGSAEGAVPAPRVHGGENPTCY